MSLKAPTTKEEGKFQYCNYGYDTTKFKSFDDCMTNYNKVFYPPTTTDNKVACKDGTKDIANGVVAPCYGRGTNSSKFPILNNNKPETFTNVKCNDGSTQSVGSNPLGGRVDVPCRNNGGVSPNQDTQKPRTFIEMNQGYIIIGVVLVAGYFAYKKFKN